MKFFSYKNLAIRILVLAIGLLLIFIFSAFLNPVKAATTKIVPYQGKLTNIDGTNVTDGSYNFKILFYDAITTGTCVYSISGSCGTPTALSVTVTNGIFYVSIGDTGTNSLSSVNFNVDLYMEVTIGTETLSPRKRIGGAAFTSLNSITDPTANLSLAMGSNTTTFTYGNVTGSAVNLFNIADTSSNTGTGYLANFATATSSAAKPFAVAARGNTIIDTTSTGGITLGNTTAAQDVNFFSTSNKITSAGNLTIAGALTVASCTGCSGAVTLSSLTAASGTNTINNANFSQVWNWATLTTQTGFALGTTTTGLTTGTILQVGGGTTAINPGAAGTGTVQSLAFIANGSNTSGVSTANGLLINSTINTTGATGTKSINGINIAAPTNTACTGGACTWTGLNIAAPGTLANTSFYAANFGTSSPLATVNIGGGTGTNKSLYVYGSANTDTVGVEAPNVGANGASAYTVTNIPGGGGSITNNFYAFSTFGITGTSSLGVTCSSVYAFVINSEGAHGWGPCNATRDTFLYRSAANTLKIDSNEAGGAANLIITGNTTIGGNGAASTSPLRLNGTILTGGTGTTNFPQFFVSPSGATGATTWSTNGTAIGVNTATGFTGNFLDFHVNGGVSVASLTSSGALTVASCTGCSGGATTLNAITAATGTNTIANANFAQTWNWGTLTTQTGLSLAASGSTLDTGTLLSVSGNYVHNAAASNTGSLYRMDITEGSSPSAGIAQTTNGWNINTILTSSPASTGFNALNGLNLTSTINASGAGGKAITMINIPTPAKTGCSGGACTWTGLNIADPGTLANTTLYSALFQGGNVGIGNSAPIALLSVGTSSALQVNASGNLSTTGTLSAGSSGQFSVTTNGYIDLSSTTAASTFNTILKTNSMHVGNTELAGGFDNGILKHVTDGRTLYNFITNSSANSLFGGGVDGEGYRRFILGGDGTWQVGTGSATPDSFFYRSTASTYKIDSNGSGGTANLIVTGNINVGSCTGCGGGAVWSSLTNPTGNLALSMASNTTTFTYGATTGSANLFNLTDTASNTGNGALLNIQTATGSALAPFRVNAAGTDAIRVTSLGKIVIGGTAIEANAVLNVYQPLSSGVLWAFGSANSQAFITDSGTNSFEFTANGGFGLPKKNSGQNGYRFTLSPTYGLIGYSKDDGVNQYNFASLDTNNVPLTLQGNSATAQTLLIQAAASQTADLTQWQNNAGNTVYASVDSAGRFMSAAAGAASKSSLLLSGTLYSAGTGTTNFPQLFIQPAGSTAVTTWNGNGTEFGVNAATGFTGTFLDFHINGGASVASIDSNGSLLLATSLYANNNLYTGATNGKGLFFTDGSTFNYAVYRNTSNQIAFRVGSGSDQILLDSTGGLSAPGAITTSAAGAASLSPLAITGAIYAAGTATTNFPSLFIQPTGSTAVTTWSTAGTAIGVNTATGFAGNFFDFHVNGGASVAKLTSGGALTVASCTGCGGGGSSLNSITAATATNTIDNTTFAQVWNWSTLTTQTGLSFGTNTTGITTGTILQVGGGTTAINPGATNTGDVLALGFIANGSNTSGNSIATGLIINSTINTSGATGTKAINAINIAAPTNTACTGGACTWTGLNIANPGTLANTTFNAATFQGGNVGIGTAIPKSTLQVNGVQTFASGSEVYFNAYTNDKYLTGNDSAFAIWHDSSQDVLHFQAANSNTGAADSSISFTDAITIKGTTANAGTVGIGGTNSGAGFLDVISAGAASRSQLSLTGSIFTGGTGTTTFPQFFIQPAAATAAITWSTAGTAIGVNTATGFTGNFFDFHVNGGASVASLTSGGALTVASCTGCGAGGSTTFNGITAATATSTIDNTNFAQIWNWSTLTSGIGLSIGNNTTTLTTGSLLNLGGNTTKYVQAGGTNTGSSIYLYTENASAGGASAVNIVNLLNLNANVTSSATTGTSITTNGVNVNTTISTSGSVPKFINALNITTPAKAICVTGACTWTGLNISDPGTLANTTFWPIYVGAGVFKVDGSGNLTVASCTGCGAGGSTSFNGITAATATSTIDNTTFAQTWNWSTLSTQTGLSLGTNTTGITTGTVLALGGGTTSINPAAAGTGNIASIGLIANASNTTGTSTANGLLFNSTINATGAGGIKEINNILINSPTQTACTGTCNWNGIKIVTPSAITNAVTTALNISAGGIPKTDMVNITNAGQATTVAGVNLLQMTYVGGAAAVESAAQRIDLTPGGTANGTWSGFRLVANATGPATSVTESGLKVEAPTSAYAGTFNGYNFIAPATGPTTNANLRAINIGAITTAGLGTENAVMIGTGWDSMINLGAPASITPTSIDFGNSTSGTAQTISGVIRMGRVSTASATCATATAQGLIFKTDAGVQAGHFCIDSANTLKFFGAATTVGTDVAENYSDINNNLEAGDVVALDITSKVPTAIHSITSPYDQLLLGIISTDPGVTLSGISEANGSTDLINPRLVALNGRIPTKVSTINGAIKKGDYITSSTINKFGQKATQNGFVVSKAIEDFDPAHGNGKIIPCPSGTPSNVICGVIITFANLIQYTAGDGLNNMMAELNSDNTMSLPKNLNLDMLSANTIQANNLNVGNGKFTVDKNGNATVQGVLSAKNISNVIKLNAIHIDANEIVANNLIVNNLQIKNPEIGDPVKGKIIIKSGQKSYTFKNQNIKSDSLILVTPYGNTPVAYTLTNKKDGEVTVQIQNKLTDDLSLDYLITN